MQIKEVDVVFNPNGKKYTFDCSNCYVKLGQKVIVETVNGLEIAIIDSKVRVVDLEDGQESELKKVLRIATPSDIKQKEESFIRAEEIKNFCRENAKSLALDIKVDKVDVSFDFSKALIFFCSESRVDFRELVKLLANKFKMRIELKQIDPREETKIMGGLAPCGRETCCSSFLYQPEHSSIKMAKIQGLSLNPSNISGLCGKLKCCLVYENEYYSETFKKMPKLNTEVTTPEGKGLVVYNDLLKQLVNVKFMNGDSTSVIKEFPLNEIKFNKDGKIND